MSIRPVDVKNLIPKTQQLSKIQQIENDKQRNFMHIQNSSQTKAIEKELRKVNNSEKTSKTRITKDKKQNKNNSKQNNNGNNDSNAYEKKEIKTNDLSDVLGINIDIKI